MPGLTRRGGGLGGSKSGNTDCSNGSSFGRYRKPSDTGSKDSGGAFNGKAKPMAPPSKLSYAKPQRAVKLLDGTPCYMSECPGWLKSPSLWAPRLSPKVVDVTSLGFGRHGSQVLRVRHRSLGHSAVVKQFLRDKLIATPRLHVKVLNEWQVHSALVPHPNVVPLYGAFEDKTYVTLIMEAQHGDLLSYLDEQDREVLSEDEARGVASDLLTALAHMHDMGFVHRDAKPENLFWGPLGPGAGAGAGSGPGAGTCSWRLGDLGSSVVLERVMQPAAPGLQLEGSPPFLSPEYAALWVAPTASRTAQLMQRATSPKQDIWGVGALLYDMLVGHPPFSGPAAAAAAGLEGAPNNTTGTSNNTPVIPMPLLAAAIMDQEPCPRLTQAETGLSAAALDFLSAALRKAPEERPSAAELLDHPWIVSEPS